jgi:hypothetical protein
MTRTTLSNASLESEYTADVQKFEYDRRSYAGRPTEHRNDRRVSKVSISLVKGKRRFISLSAIILQVFKLERLTMLRKVLHPTVHLRINVGDDLLVRLLKLEWGLPNPVDSRRDPLENPIQFQDLHECRYSGRLSKWLLEPLLWVNVVPVFVINLHRIVLVETTYVVSQ